MGTSWLPKVPAPVAAGAVTAAPARRNTGTAQQAPALLPVLDPYFRWAEVTAFAGLERAGLWPTGTRDTQALRIIGRWREGSPPVPVPAELDLPPVYAQAGRHFTAAVLFRDLPWLKSQTLFDWKLAMALRDANAERQASPQGEHGVDRDENQLPGRNLAAPALLEAESQGQRLDTPALGLSGAVAIIDFGCPFLNEAFADDGGTRVRALWDQGAPVMPPGKPDDYPWPWHEPRGFAYGRALGPVALDTMAGAARAAGAADESALYRGIDYLIHYGDPRRRVWLATHGGHVLHMAGGHPDPLRPAEPADGAGRADLVFVQLPSATAADGAGGSLAAHLLDGIRFAMGCVAPGEPLVVSISYGNVAGPHDGQSLVEQAVQELLGQRSNFAIVVAAGNSRAAGAHARRTVRGRQSVQLRLDVVAGDTTDTFVEAWYPANGRRLQARVRTPQGHWSDWIGQGEEQRLEDDTSRQHRVALLTHHGRSVHGGGARVLLALAPTSQPPGVVRGLASPGRWDLELRLDPNSTTGSGVVELDAWIEREDPVREAGGRHTRFADQLRDDELGTWAALATAPGVIRAGGFNLGSGRPAPYSSLPDTPDPALFVMAACEEDAVNPNIAAAATRSLERYRMSGTSVAAPVLARRLYNHMVALKKAGKGGVGRTGWPKVLRALATGDDAFVQPFRRD
jgi:Subtilase family